MLSQELLATPERYKILSDLNSETYHTNCFIYALRHTKVIRENIISYIKTHITNTYIKTKDIVFIGNKFVLSFIPYEGQDRPSEPGVFKVQKIGKKKNN